MNRLPKYEFEAAIIEAAANAYLLMDKEVPQDIVLWEALELHRFNPTKLAIAKGGLIKLMGMRELMAQRVIELEPVD